MTKVLILDSSKSMRNILRERLEYEGYSTEVAADRHAAEALCRRQRFDVILTDRSERMPDSDTPFIVISDEGTMEAAVAAVRHGARDFLTKPVDMNRLLQTIRDIIEPAAREVEPATTADATATDASSVPTPPPTEAVGRSEQSASHEAPSGTQRDTTVVDAPTRRRRRATGEEMIGTSAEIEQIRHLVARVAPCEARVLITGENGTGKELVARSLHAQSRRAAAPFVEVNCAAIPSELIESELFGHERGAFTSAVKQRRGKFEQADGGTLFMDEIGDMSLAAQAKVLRALQESRISRVGSDKDIAVNVRVLAATNKDLRAEIARGNFREDLYHRLSVVIIRVPALRERREDIPLLVHHFLRQLAEEYQTKVKPIDEAALQLLQAGSWSGNIRELRNVVERLMILSDERITAADVERYC